MLIKSTKTKKEKPNCKFIGRFSVDGGLQFGEYTKAHLKEYAKNNPNLPFELKPIIPESSNQRRFFEGAICPLVTFYQENMDYRQTNDVNKIREWLKMEFNGELVVIANKTHKVAKSTSNILNLGFIERIIDWLEHNYSINNEVLNPEKYKYWKDVVYPYGGPDNYIDYLKEIKLL